MTLGGISSLFEDAASGVQEDGRDQGQSTIWDAFVALTA
jgi:hypothetical protein